MAYMKGKGQTMARTNVIEFDPEDGPRVVGYFDPDKAEATFEEAQRWDGNNMVGVHCGRWNHEQLYRTPAGRWVLHHWSQWQNSQPSYTFLTGDKARTWLLTNQDAVSDTAIEDYFGPLEDESGPEVK